MKYIQFFTFRDNSGLALWIYLGNELEVFHFDEMSYVWLNKWKEEKTSKIPFPGTYQTIGKEKLTSTIN